MRTVALATPTTAGIPCSWATTAPWEMEPPSSQQRRARTAINASLQQAEFSGFQSRLRPVAHPQLAQDVAEVVLDGAAGDVEGLADLAIGSPTPQQGQDLTLALGQLRHVAHAGECRSGRSDHCGLDGGRGEGGK